MGSGLRTVLCHAAATHPGSGRHARPHPLVHTHNREHTHTRMDAPHTCTCTSTSALPENTPHPHPQAMLDTSGDGHVSQEEFLAAAKGSLEAARTAQQRRRSSSGGNPNAPGAASTGVALAVGDVLRRVTAYLRANKVGVGGREFVGWRSGGLGGGRSVMVSCGVPARSAHAGAWMEQTYGEGGVGVGPTGTGFRGHRRAEVGGWVGGCRAWCGGASLGCGEGHPRGGGGVAS